MAEVDVVNELFGLCHCVRTTVPGRANLRRNRSLAQWPLFLRSYQKECKKTDFTSWNRLFTCVRCGGTLHSQMLVGVLCCRVLTYYHLHNSLEIAPSVGRIDEEEPSDKAPPLDIHHIRLEDREPSIH